MLKGSCSTCLMEIGPNGKLGDYETKVVSTFVQNTLMAPNCNWFSTKTPIFFIL